MIAGLPMVKNVEAEMFEDMRKKVKKSLNFPEQ